MPSPRFEAPEKAKTENRRNGGKPRTEHANPSAINRWPQIFGEKRRRAKRHQVQFEQQFQRFPGRTLAPARIEIQRHAHQAEQECTSSEKDKTAPDPNLPAARADATCTSKSRQMCTRLTAAGPISTNLAVSP